MSEEFESLLAISDLRIAFGEREVVHGIDLQVAAGEVLALVGESGSGKSVTAMSIARLLQGASYPTGIISFDGRDVLPLSETELHTLRGRDIGMVFQEPMTALNPTMRIGVQVGEALQVHGLADQAGIEKQVNRVAGGCWYSRGRDARWAISASNVWRDEAAGMYCARFGVSSPFADL